MYDLNISQPYRPPRRVTGIAILRYSYLCNEDNSCTCSAPWLVARDGGSAVPQLELDITDAENIASGNRQEVRSAPAFPPAFPRLTWHKASDLELGLRWSWVQPQDSHPATYISYQCIAHHSARVACSACPHNGDEARSQTRCKNLSLHWSEDVSLWWKLNKMQKTYLFTEVKMSPYDGN
jgi:hypothetical protein